jgi:chromate reductase, NAD(P)H dehydrogenase (quinone)
MTRYKVGYFVGSLSSTSINRTLSKALIRLAPDDLGFREIQINDLPLYSNDATATFLRGFMAEFRIHVARVLTVLPRS